MQCPKCKTELGMRATYCGCGWKRRPTTSEEMHADAHIECAYEGCSNSAMHKIKTPIGYASMCNPHYDEYFSKQALANLNKYGMERAEGESRYDHIQRMREFVKTGFKGFARRQAAR